MFNFFISFFHSVSFGFGSGEVSTLLTRGDTVQYTKSFVKRWRVQKPTWIFWQGPEGLLARPKKSFGKTQQCKLSWKTLLSRVAGPILLSRMARSSLSSRVQCAMSPFIKGLPSFNTHVQPRNGQCIFQGPETSPSVWSNGIGGDSCLCTLPNDVFIVIKHHSHPPPSELRLLSLWASIFRSEAQVVQKPFIPHPICFFSDFSSPLPPSKAQDPHLHTWVPEQLQGCGVKVTILFLNGLEPTHSHPLREWRPGLLGLFWPFFKVWIIWAFVIHGIIWASVPVWSWRWFWAAGWGGGAWGGGCGWWRLALFRTFCQGSSAPAVSTCINRLWLAFWQGLGFRLGFWFSPLFSLPPPLLPFLPPPFVLFLPAPFSSLWPGLFPSSCPFLLALLCLSLLAFLCCSSSHLHLFLFLFLSLLLHLPSHLLAGPCRKTLPFDKVLGSRATFKQGCQNKLFELKAADTKWKLYLGPWMLGLPFLPKTFVVFLGGVGVITNFKVQQNLLS